MSKQPSDLNRPTFEGRILPNPAEPPQDQGLQFDLTTLRTRRGLLGLFGAGAAALAVSACTPSSPSSTSTPTASAATTSAATTGAESSASTSGDLTEIPEETAGPYPGDGSNGADVLEQSGVVRSDIRSSFGTSTTTAEGIPLTIRLTVLDLANGGAPFTGVAVYVWHCDRAGNYSMYSSGVENENYLRGVQITDASGVVEFTSIFPACYSGRWPHIHFEVYPNEAAITDATNKIATSQLALPQNVCDTVYATSGYEQSVSNLSRISLSSDNVFGEDSAAHQLATMSGDVNSGYTATLTVPVDTRTEPGSAGAPGGNGGGPGGRGR